MKKGDKNMPYALYWKGKKLTEQGIFKTRKEAETTMGIELTQMELANFTPLQLKRWLQIKKVKK